MKLTLPFQPASHTYTRILINSHPSRLTMVVVVVVIVIIIIIIIGSQCRAKKSNFHFDTYHCLFFSYSSSLERIFRRYSIYRLPWVLFPWMPCYSVKLTCHLLVVLMKWPVFVQYFHLNVGHINISMYTKSCYCCFSSVLRLTLSLQFLIEDLYVNVLELL